MFTSTRKYIGQNAGFCQDACLISECFLQCGHSWHEQLAPKEIYKSRIYIQEQFKNKRRWKVWSLTREIKDPDQEQEHRTRRIARTISLLGRPCANPTVCPASLVARMLIVLADRRGLRKRTSRPNWRLHQMGRHTCLNCKVSMFELGKLSMVTFALHTATQCFLDWFNHSPFKWEFVLVSL